MYLLIAQIDPNLLSVTGVIATILAVIFALGAFTNSRTRKKHMLELEKAQRAEQAMHFRPAKSQRPGRSSHPARSSGSSTMQVTVTPKDSSRRRSSTPRAAPVAKSSTPPEEMSEKKNSEKPVLFRKVRPDGLDTQLDSVQDEDQQQYVWE